MTMTSTLKVTSAPVTMTHSSPPTAICGSAGKRKEGHHRMHASMA